VQQNVVVYFRRYFELSVWVIALTLLAFMNPATDAHFSLCVFKWMGFSFCPGCGLGHSISWLFHGDIEQSFREHPLGIAAVMILLHRIYTLIKKRTVYLTA
jgi:hypothetical protein